MVKQKKKIDVWYYVVWALGIVALGLLLFSIIRSLI